MSAIFLLFLRLVLTVVLYAFLGWGLLVLWRDLRRQSEVLAGQQNHPIVLQWQVEGELTTHRFTRTEIIIGRDPACDVFLDDRTVSLRHARLAFHHQQWWLEDLESTNGTMVNQEPVISPIVITEGDQICCGQAQLTVAR